MNASFHTIRLGCGIRGAGMGAGEGIGWFAAKRDDVPDGRAPGIAAVMAGRLWDLTPLGPPKGGNHQSAVAGAAGHLSGKPGRRGVFVMVIGYGLLVIETVFRYNGGEW